MNFLKNGDSYYQILSVPDSISAPLCQLDKAFSNHMRIHNKKDKCKIGGDHYAIKACGYEVVRLNMCKICQLEANVANCGAKDPKDPNYKPDGHYDVKNRFRRWEVKGMEIVPKKPLPPSSD